MTNSQYKKHQVYLFNMERAERLAYKMDSQMFPLQSTSRKGGVSVSRLSKQALMLTLLAAGVGHV